MTLIVVALLDPAVVGVEDSSCMEIRISLQIIKERNNETQSIAVSKKYRLY